MAVKVKKIGLLTSGGDAPGMNAAIRSVVRTAVYHGVKVFGIQRGYEGLIDGEIEEMNARSVTDIIHRGGTILKTARCPAMMTAEGREKAAAVYDALKLDALMVIGGNGSLSGALELSKLGLNCIGIPGTIDLDLDCTEYTIGFDTAVNTGMKAINKIRDTSSSHERCSVVEVMGRHAGFIALWCGISGGAEEVLVPESGEVNRDAIIQLIMENRTKGKSHNMIVVAEGVGGSVQLAKDIEKITGIETRATILGHLQRGGSPTAVDRYHASVMGHEAVRVFLEGAQNRIIVYRDGKHTHVDLEEGLNYRREYDSSIYDITKILAI
ncbi:MAG: 6-phosphofructokinase [Clostridiales bacterium]|nr:6-phosphofructokinase [Clostridiales bacterium]